MEQTIALVDCAQGTHQNLRVQQVCDQFRARVGKIKVHTAALTASWDIVAAIQRDVECKLTPSRSTGGSTDKVLDKVEYAEIDLVQEAGILAVDATIVVSIKCNKGMGLCGMQRNDLLPG